MQLVGQANLEQMRGGNAKYAVCRLRERVSKHLQSAFLGVLSIHAEAAQHNTNVRALQRCSASTAGLHTHRDFVFLE